MKNEMQPSCWSRWRSLWTFLLSRLSIPIRPVVYEDSEVSVRRNWVLCGVFLAFLVSAILILYYQLSQRPFNIYANPVNLQYQKSSTTSSWDPSASMQLVSLAVTAETSRERLDCNCGVTLWNDLMMGWLNISELSTCRALIAPLIQTNASLASLYSNMCTLVADQAQIVFDSAVIPSTAVLLPPMSWQQYLYQAYYYVCMNVVLGMYSTEYFASFANVSGSLSVNVMQSFWTVMLGDLQSNSGSLCLGYTFDLTVSPPVQIRWAFDDVLPNMDLYRSKLQFPDAKRVLTVPETFQNYWTPAGATTGTNTPLYDSYVAVYCSPTTCATYRQQPVTSVLLNTVGTLGIVWLGATVVGTALYTTLLFTKTSTTNPERPPGDLPGQVQEIDKLIELVHTKLNNLQEQRRTLDGSSVPGSLQLNPLAHPGPAHHTGLKWAGPGAIGAWLSGQHGSSHDSLSPRDASGRTLVPPSPTSREETVVR
eukprot:gnl/Spiro4/25564_TR12735_c0_g1_i1.p1 gnl/Spiro4/25564_TR12735_c0_g1~~gnl/Spiro4/25564_TR12735_c0_g1_i1.p1  ORF type:complete len:480 (-),score=117.75 gnl/Spiro4/25564_TR12735_c0_g1_i1:160-1599(-)